LGHIWPVTKENLHSVIEANHPFVISMADGKDYAVPHRDFIAFIRKGTAVVLTTEDDRIHVLPFLTMTGVSRGASVTGD